MKCTYYSYNLSSGVNTFYLRNVSTSSKRNINPITFHNPLKFTLHEDSVLLDFQNYIFKCLIGEMYCPALKNYMTCLGSR
jgi:hypothetical protein